MSNYYVLVVEQNIKTFSMIGHGQDFKYELTEKGIDFPLRGLETNDKIIGFISNEIRKFSYLFSVEIKNDSDVHFIKTFETIDGPSLDEINSNIKESILSKEQSKSLIPISEEEYYSIVALMTKAASNKLLTDFDLFKITNVASVEANYTVEELGRILRDMYDNAEKGDKSVAIHVFGIKFAKYMIEKGFTPKQISVAAGFGDTQYDTEINKAKNIYRCLAAGTYGVSILDKNGHIARIEPQGIRKTGGENVLLYGVPGAGKSHYIKEKYCSDNKYMERVVFHPDYSYADFVGQIMPQLDGERLRYAFTPGPFTKILKSAYEDPENYYYLVIEEINRGNAPAIFGEIFQLLDRKKEDDDNKSKFGESEYGITNFDIAREVYGDESREILIPSNLWILSTMNTADQNVFTLDTAFQRRWTMKHIENKVESAKHAHQLIGNTNINWQTFATVTNEMVLDINRDIGSSDDKRLGAYFAGTKELEPDRFPEKVLKYLWDDAFRMDRIAYFSDEAKSLEFVIETFATSKNDPLSLVLRSEVYNKMLTLMNDNHTISDINDSEAK